MGDVEVTRSAWAEALNNGDFVCISTCSGYRRSIRDPNGVEHLLAPTAGDQELGAALLDALAHSRFVTPEEDLALYDYKSIEKRYAKWVDGLMAAYSYKGKRALFKDMKRCGIECRQGVITIKSSCHEKLEAWSGTGISEQEFVVIPQTSTPCEVGAALRLAFSRCV